jgi:hypothetical protein
MKRILTLLSLGIVLLLSSACGNEDQSATCSDGNCKCNDGQTCHFQCTKGNCSHDCGAGSACTSSCQGGGCRQSCSATAQCDFSCSGGSCTQACLGNTHCSASCADQSCVSDTTSSAPGLGGAAGGVGF